jgi:hypothetical protein
MPKASHGDNRHFGRVPRTTGLPNSGIRPGTPLSLDDARRLVSGYVDNYNSVRLNSATGYITPKDMLAGRQREIHAERDRRLEEARRQRQIRRRQAVDVQLTPVGHGSAGDGMGSSGRRRGCEASISGLTIRTGAGRKVRPC